MTAGDHSESRSAERALSRTADFGSRHCSAPRAMSSARTETSTTAACQQLVCVDAAALWRRSCRSSEQDEAAIAFDAEIGRDERADRAAIAQIEDPDETFSARLDRLRGDGIDDDLPRPVRPDLDVTPRI